MRLVVHREELMSWPRQYPVQHARDRFKCSAGMQAALNGLDAKAEIELTQAEAAPTVRAKASVHTCMRFLDNASSNWEWLLCPWMMSAEYLYARPSQDRVADNEPAQIVSIDSRQNAIVHFTPACLLTIGDVIACEPPVAFQGTAAVLCSMAVSPCTVWYTRLLGMRICVYISVPSRCILHACM